MQTRGKRSAGSSAKLPIPDSVTALALRELHVYEDMASHSAAMQMAVDEALFASATAPALRFYHWRQPSLSFGYFGRFADVAAEAGQRELVRRWTGGGLVLHGNDLTYSLVLPPSYLPTGCSARAVYSSVHAALVEALAGAGKIELAARDAPKVSDACFANPVTADVLADGRKIAGAAQRRTRAGLLQQGSVQFNQLPVNFTVRFATALCPRFEHRGLDLRLLHRAEALAAEKYATAAWLHRH